MASTDQYLKAFDPAKPMQDRFNYEAFLSNIGQTAAKTRQVGGPKTVAMPDFAGGDRATLAKDSKSTNRWAPSGAFHFTRNPDFVSPEERALLQQREGNIARGEAGIKTYESQRTAMTKDAEKAASALEMKGANTAEQMRRLGVIEGDVRAQQAGASEMYGAAAEKAEEYVMATRQRAQDSLARLDEINREIGEGRNFSKAHAMQVGVQATIGSMNEEGRQIAEKYGTDSKEYQGWNGRKQTSLATLNSNIHVGYQKIQEAQDIAYLNASNESMWKGDMYINFHEHTPLIH